MNQSTISVIIPALNEEENLEAAVQTVEKIVRRYFRDWEILIFDDGSQDLTGVIADRLALTNSRTRVTHHHSAKNLGACYKEGLQQATKDYVIMIPGDNECGAEVMEPVFALAGKADMIIPYTKNGEVRPRGRRILSQVFVTLINTISGLKLEYYNGAVLHRTDLIKTFPIGTDGFGYQAELLVRMVRRGCTYREVGTLITYRPGGKSKALRLNNIWKVCTFLLGLFMETRVRRQRLLPQHS